MVIIGRRFENQNLQILAILFSCFVQVFKGCPVEGCHKTNIKSGHPHVVLEGLLPDCLVNYSNGLIEHLRRYHPEVLPPNLSQINSIVDGNANIMIMLIAGAIIAFIYNCIITFYKFQYKYKYKA